MMKHFVVFFLIVFAVGIYAQALCTDKMQFIATNDRIVLFKGKIAGEIKGWLAVETYNGTEWNSNGYEPSFTRVVTSYKPMMRKLSNGTYELMFVNAK